MLCCLSRNTAWLSCSLKIATRTLAPVTSRLPELCTWNTALQDALEAQRRLGFALVVVLRDQRRGGIDEFLVAPQLVQVGTARTQYRCRRLIVQQGQQQVLNRHEFMAFGPRLLEGEIEGDFELSIQHGFTSLPNIRSTVFLYLAEQWMLALPCILIDLHRLGFGHVPGKQAADRLTLSMYRQHDLGGFSRSMLKNTSSTSTTKSIGV